MLLKLELPEVNRILSLYLSEITNTEVNPDDLEWTFGRARHESSVAYECNLFALGGQEPPKKSEPVITEPTLEDEEPETDKEETDDLFG